MDELIQILIKQYISEDLKIPKELEGFIKAVNKVVYEMQVEKSLLERCLRISSQELLEKNEDLRLSHRELEKYNSTLERMVEARTKELINALKEADKARVIAEKANTAKSDFLANMSHEIRTPMNGVLGVAEILLQTKLSQKQKEYVNILQKTGYSLLQIINNILDLSKIEAGKLTINNIPFNLYFLVEDVVQMLEIKAFEVNIELIFRYAPNTPKYVIGDPDRIRQVLINLIGNSIKFTTKGYVYINVEAIKKADLEYNFVFSVEDTGIGIAEDKIKVIFDKFSQVDNSSTRKYGGTGLGLTITDNLVRLMNGTIQVQSKLNKGTSFKVYLDLNLDDSYFLQEEVKYDDLSYLRVMIIDDCAIASKILEEQMDNLNISSTSFSNCLDALEMLVTAKKNDNPYHLIFLDQTLSDIDIIEFANMVKENLLISKTKLILLGNLKKKNEIKDIKNSGFSGMLSKPIRVHQLPGILTKLSKYYFSDNKVKEKFISNYNVTQTHKKSYNKIGLLNDPINANVLVVEDNKANQKIVVWLLEKIGCITHIANNGQEAFEMYKDNDFDIIFMDCQMPEMDGYEASKLIRNYEKSNNKNHTPIIALTANAMQSEYELTSKAGMDDFLSKPVSIKNLRKMLEKYYLNSTSRV